MDAAEVLREQWGLEPVRVETLTGGMNAAAYLAVSADWRFVVKVVGADDGAFEPGLEVARRADDAGVVTGRPRPSRSGRLVERVDGRQVAVLEYVEGVELGKSAADQAAIGELLGRVHLAVGLESSDLDDWLRLLLPLDEHLDYEPWIRPAVEGAKAGVRSVGLLSWAWLHGDPAAEAFRRGPDGRISLIDWGSAMRGPILYDVASAVMYNGEHLVPSYLAVRPDLASELNRGLAAFLQIRYAVQAAYFAWRCAEDIRTGITSAADNHKGLADARRSFEL
ncbi:phosphotransferase [Kribbella sp. NPDC026611]|uniref:phosphotransferase enzyme family protein n=1 Tax=Kribbella sp. NPDC026611 TaxID=3154911 RepID=UPI0033EE7A9E